MKIFYDDLEGVGEDRLTGALEALNRYFGECVSREEIVFAVVDREGGKAIGYEDKTGVFTENEGADLTARSVVRASLRGDM